jgi:uncharacterized damage-inducible protein DinB
VDYPDVIGGVRVTTGDLLVHLISHLAYHLGQIDYHRRLLAGGGALKSVPVQELATARPT